MKTRLTLVAFALSALTAFAATGDVMMSVRGPDGRFVPTYLTPSASMVIGFDESGVLTVKEGGGGAIAIDDVTGLQAALDLKLTTTTAASTYLSQANAASTYLTQSAAAAAYALLSHTHSIANITGLQDALDAKLATTTAASTYLSQANAISTYLSQANAASTYLTQSAAAAGYAPLSHTHTIANVTGLQDALDAKLATSTAASTYLTISNAASTYLTQANAASTYALLSHTHSIANVTGLQDALDAKLATTTAASTYLTISNAASTYLTQSSAASTYLTQANATANYQPLDSDLTAIAALTTTSFGRGLLTQSSLSYLPLAGGTVTGDTIFSSSTASTSSTTGAVRVSAGGLGVAGAIQAAGNVVSSGNIFAGTGNTIGFSSRSRFSSAADGQVTVSNVSATTTLLQWGGTTNSFPGLVSRTTNGFTVQSAAGTATFNDATGGAQSLRYALGISAPTFSASSSSSISQAATLYLGGAPANGTNGSISNPYTLLADAGTSLFKGRLYVQIGNSTGIAAVGGALTSYVLDTTEPDGDVETDLHSLPIPAASFATDGDCVYVEIDYSIGNFSDGCTLRIKVAGNTILTVSGDSTVSGNGSLKLKLLRMSSGVLQYKIVHDLQPDGGVMTNSRSELSVSFGSGIPLVITGQSGPGGLVHAQATLMDYRRAY